MSETIKVLKPSVSSEEDRCTFCREKFDGSKGIFRHGIMYPAQLRGGLVCDNCAEAYNIVCECCEAGIGSVENFIFNVMNS